MSKRYLLFIALTGFVWLAACNKEKIAATGCQQLQNGISSNNTEEVKSAINKFITSLSSQTYSEQNLNKLVDVIGQQCGTSVTMLCFDCIKTLPSQSEIRISYPGTTGPVEKTIDIIYTASHKMAFNNMHE